MVNFFTLLELIKDLLPFMVSIFTYISLLFIYKAIFRTHRTNPFVYIVSLITTIAMYYSFIYVFKLSRTDYFLDGVKFIFNYFESFGAYLFAMFVSLARCIQNLNISMMISFIHLGETFITYIRCIGFETCLYIAFHTSYKFKKSFNVFIKYIENKVSNMFVYTFKANVLNCVYTC